MNDETAAELQGEMNLEFVCFFVAFEASEAAKFEDGQLAYLDILYLVQSHQHGFHVFRL